MGLAIVLTVLFMNGEALGLMRASAVPAYAGRLFDDSYVHTLEIVLEDWETFLETATDEKYTSCTITC